MNKFYLIITILCLTNLKLDSYELSIGAIFKNEAPYLREWVEYHLMVGVEHFWLFNNESTDNWEEVLAPYIQKGLIEVTYWPSPEVSLRLASIQIPAYKQILTLAKDQTKWLAFIDIDEFILPMVDKTVTECLNKHYANASGVFINWRMFGTSQITIPLYEPIIFHLTSCSWRTHPSNAVSKSIVRPNHVDIDQVWYAHHFPLYPQYKYHNGDGQELEMVELDLRTDGYVHDKFIRINHYCMRDEYYFWNRRLPRIIKTGLSKDLLFEHYESYLLSKDRKILDFIQRYHPAMFEKIWYGIYLPFDMDFQLNLDLRLYSTNFDVVSTIPDAISDNGIDNHKH